MVKWLDQYSQFTCKQKCPAAGLLWHRAWGWLECTAVGGGEPTASPEAEASGLYHTEQHGLCLRMRPPEIHLHLPPAPSKLMYTFCVPQSTGSVWYVGLAILASCLAASLRNFLPSPALSLSAAGLCPGCCSASLPCCERLVNLAVDLSPLLGG